VSRRLFPLVLVAILALSAACQGSATPAPTVAPSAAPPAMASASATAAGLSLTGLVATPLSLSEADLHAMDVAKITADKPKGGGSADFQGVRLSVLFQKAGVNADAKTASLTGADGFVADVALGDIAKCADCMVAFGDSPGHLQMVMPGMTGKAWVKDVVKIELK
jgi:DMSO/TMAO reductase YedYZ molybdopterin-dependent catalytic subunit